MRHESYVVGTEGYTFDGDLDLRLYRVSADKAAFEAGGVLVLDFTSGRVKLGAGVSLEFAVGAGNFDMSSSTGTFKTPSGQHSFAGALTITSAGANALAVGANGATNPVLKIDASTASVATGVSVKGAAAASRVAVAVLSSGANEGLDIDAKGSGTIRLGNASTGNIALARPVDVTGAILGTSAGAQALAVGLAGATNPALEVDASTASSATGVRVKSAAAASGVAVSAISSGTNENLTLDAKGSGTITLATTSTGNIVAKRALVADLGITSIGPTAGIGYATGAGGTVTQATNKSTAVTLSKVCGTIVMNGAALAGDTTVAFTLTNTAIAVDDMVLVNHDLTGTMGAYSFGVTPAAGSALVSVHNNTAGSLSEAIQLRFVVIKAVVA